MPNTTLELVKSPVDLAANFMPIFTTDTALQRYQAFKDFVKGVLKEGTDFGKNPGSDRDTLLKPGAEKLCTFFGLTPSYEYEKVIEDWMGKKYGQPLFYYRIKCQLHRGDFKIGEGIAACSSWEVKYRYRWVDEKVVERMGLDKATLATKGGAISEFDFAINKKETSGAYGKPAEYWAKWTQAIESGKARKINKAKKDGTTSPAYEMDMTMYRVPNSDFGDIINTVLKIAQKRAYVAATLSATNASDYFTQDLEDYIDTDPIPPTPSGHDHSSPQRSSAPAPRIGAAQPHSQPTAHVIHPVIEAEVVTMEPDVDQKPEPTPTPTPTPAFKGSHAVPEALQSLWRQMFAPEGRMQVFDMFKANMIKSLGEEEGSRAFYAVLNRHNAKEPRDLNKSLSDARKAAKDLYDVTQPLLPKAVA
jgi:hypothetical protein